MTALSFGYGRGQIRLDGREQGSDEVTATLLEHASEADLRGQGVLGRAGGADAGDQAVDVGSSSIGSISAISMLRLEPSQA